MHNGNHKADHVSQKEECRWEDKDMTLEPDLSFFSHEEAIVYQQEMEAACRKCPENSDSNKLRVYSYLSGLLSEQ